MHSMGNRWRGGNGFGEGRLSGEERVQRRLNYLLEQVYGYLDRNRPDRALDRLDQVAQGLRERPEYLVAWAETLYELGRAHEALERLRPEFEKDEVDPAIAYTFASLNARLGYNATAYAAFSRYAEVVEDDPLNLDSAKAALELLEDYLDRAASGTQLSRHAFLEVGLLNDEGQVRMQHSEFETALRIFDRAREMAPNWMGPRNNRSLCLYYLGRVEQAVREAEAVLSEFDPENTHALANLVQYLSAVGRDEEVQAYLELLRAKHPQEDHSLEKRILAFGFAEDAEGLWKVAQDLPDQERLPPSFGSASYYLLGAGAANLGHVEAARELFLKARDLGDPLERAQRALDALDRSGDDEPPNGPGLDGRFPYVHFSELLPNQVVEDLLEVDRMGSTARAERLSKLGQRYPQLVAVGEKMIWDEAEVRAGVDFLSLLDTPAAYEAIRRFASSQHGNFEDRMGAFHRLKESGQLSSDETHRAWDEQAGTWREVRTMGWQLHDEPDDPPELAEDFDEIRDLIGEDDFETAERRLDDLWERHPGRPEVASLYGALCVYMGQVGRAEDWFRRALRQDPEYHLARVELASLLAFEGDPDAAATELAHVERAEKLSYMVLAGYLRANAEIAMERGQFESAEESIQRLEDVFPSSPWPEMLREDLLEARFRHSQRNDLHRYHRRKRGQVIAPGAKLVTCLDRVSREALAGTARAWGVSSAGRKAELIERLAEAIDDEENLGNQLQDLRGKDRRALRAVLKAGGWMHWKHFRVEHGDDLNESPYWQWHEPNTVPGVLRMHGLLAIGTHEEQVIVVIPEELRSPLENLLEM